MRHTGRARWILGLLAAVASLPMPSSAADVRRRGVEGLLDGYEFVKVADTATPIPGGTGTFTELGTPSIGGGTIAFRADGPDRQAGIYAFIDGALTRVADRNTPAPGGSGNFEGFGFVTSAHEMSVASDGSVAFIGTSGEREGIYTNRTGALTRLLGETDPVPGNPGAEWTNLFHLSHDSGQVAFTGRSTGERQGLYLTDGESLSLIADTTMPMPGATENFWDFERQGGEPSLHGGEVVFVGYGYNRTYTIYGFRGGTLRTIVDQATRRPGTLQTFFQLAAPVLRDGEVAFWSGGIYLAREDGVVVKVVRDSKTPIAAGFGFSNGDPALDGGVVAFQQETWYTLQPYYYTHIGDSIVTTATGRRQHLVDSARTSRLDGKRVDRLFSGREALRAGTYVFKATFEDGSEAIYLARPR